MGKGSKPTIGFWYSMMLHFGLSLPVDAILEIRGDVRTAWKGEQAGSGNIRINARNLYGGEKKEGGIDGTLTVLMGEQTQTPNAYLQQVYGTAQPAYRGLCTAVFNGVVGAMNPYIKTWSFKVRGISNWLVPVWEPTLARIGEGMNPAHIIYRLCVEVRGWDASKLDLVRMKAAAQTLYDEGLGLCLKWSRSDSLDTFIATVCDHVGGLMAEDPSTGQHFLRLLRGDYDPATLPLLDASNVIDVQEWDVPQLDGTVNRVTVTYRDIVTNKDAAVTYENAASREAQGAAIEQQKQYPGLWNGDLAARIAARDCHAISALLVTGKLVVQRGAVDIVRGDVLAFTWTFGNVRIERMPLRVIDIDEGDSTDTKLTLSVAQDVFGVPATTYNSTQPVPPPPDTAPHPITVQRLVESSWRDLAARLGAGDLAQVDALAGFVGSLGMPPVGVAYDYTLMTRLGTTGAYATRGSGDLVPGGQLQFAIGPTDTALALTGFVRLDQVSVGTEALIDDELVRVDAIDTQVGAVTIARGCVDTVPAAHAAGARMWFTDNHTGVDTTEYVTGEQVQALLLTRAPQGQLDPAQATPVSITLAQRAARPYPPGNLKINGATYPASVTGAITVTWSHRDRHVQADQLVDTTQGNIGPETGVTYTVRVYLGGVLQSTTTGITGTSVTPTSPIAGSVRIEVEAVRDGLKSWQMLAATFAYTP